MFSKAALSTRSNNSFTATTVCVEIIAVCFMFFGGLGLYGAFLRPVGSIIAARTWVPTPCTIIASAVKEHRRSGGDRTYSLEITYSYLFKGKPHQSDLYDFFSGSSSSLGWRNAVVDSLPPGRVTTCYVNPREPSQAVINRDLHARVFISVLATLFVLVRSSNSRSCRLVVSGRPAQRSSFLRSHRASARPEFGCRPRCFSSLIRRRWSPHAEARYQSAPKFSSLYSQRSSGTEFSAFLCSTLMRLRTGWPLIGALCSCGPS